MRTRGLVISLAIVMLVTLGACAPSTPASVQTVTRPTAEATATPAKVLATEPAGSGEGTVTEAERALLERLDEKGREVLSLAREELAGNLGVKPEEIRLLDVEVMRWSDSSLGCPESGKMYAQVITPGYRYLLAHAGQEYDYHASEGGLFKLCKAE